jgi:hypothetical protein
MKRTKTIQDLSPEDLHHLAHLLSLPRGTSPHEDWLRAQTQHISTLPPTLQKCPSLLLSLLSTSLPLSSTKAYLCSAHRSLNPYLIHHIFLLISAECTTRLVRLVANPLPLPARISAFVNRLHALNALWMAPGLYRLAFGEMPMGAARRERISSGCEACLVAAVGGDESALSDLRAALLGRRKRGRPVAELLVLVEAWIRCVPRGEEIFALSEELGAEILRCRREMQKARRREKKNVAGEGADKEVSEESTTLMSGTSEEDGRDENDFEGSIIDFYANMLSSTSLVTDSLPVNDFHPTFGDSRYSPSAAFVFRRTSTVPQRYSWHTAYSESIYSNSIKDSTSCRDSKLKHEGETLDEYAEPYRELVVVAEEYEQAEERVCVERQDARRERA